LPLESAERLMDVEAGVGTGATGRASAPPGGSDDNLALIAIAVDGPASVVMAGLVPPSTPSGSAIDSLIQINFHLQLLKLDMTVFSWMAGTSPAMTT
jgi:hypothetical protein